MREYDAFECELKFHLFQFRIHFDLRNDYENELFYMNCGGGEVYNLIQKSNNYNQNYKKCFDEYLFQIDEDETKFTIKSNGIFTDYVFYLTVALFLILLGPVLCLTCNHLYLDFKNDAIKKDLNPIQVDQSSNQDLNLSSSSNIMNDLQKIKKKISDEKQTDRKTANITKYNRQQSQTEIDQNAYLTVDIQGPGTDTFIERDSDILNQI